MVMHSHRPSHTDALAPPFSRLPPLAAHTPPALPPTRRTPHSTPTPHTPHTPGDPLWAATDGSRYQALINGLGRALVQHQLNMGDVDAAEGDDDEGDEPLLEETTLETLRRAVAEAPANGPLRAAIGAAPLRERRGFEALMTAS